jgi:hypothetical protein
VTFAPHFGHSLLGASEAPHSGQNLPPFASAPHCGQCTTIVASKFTPSVWSRSRSFPVACSTAISACLRPSRAGGSAHRVHRLRSAFQQISRQAHWPQRLHWTNSGLISATASASAPSWAGPPMAS